MTVFYRDEDYSRVKIVITTEVKKELKGKIKEIARKAALKSLRAAQVLAPV